MIELGGRTAAHESEELKDPARMPLARRDRRRSPRNMANRVVSTWFCTKIPSSCRAPALRRRRYPPAARPGQGAQAAAQAPEKDAAGTETGGPTPTFRCCYSSNNVTECRVLHVRRSKACLCTHVVGWGAWMRHPPVDKTASGHLDQSHSSSKQWQQLVGGYA